ncbi:hypothetical protein JHK85_006353 [Glycine max]|nr:hypothetical protein JHK85_006353 [Glycine max]
MTSKPSPIEDNFEMKAMKSMGAMEDSDAMFSFGVLVNIHILGNVPVYHGTKLKVLDRRVRIRELVFICSWGRIYSSSITFRNTAGAKNPQAVAFCVLDQTYQCFTNVALKVIKTRYISTLRGNSIECNIYGTVDFIFGNAAVVLQNCNTLQETLPT